MERLYEKLKKCSSRESIRNVFFGEVGLSFPAKQKFDSTEQVLYIFRKEKRFLDLKGIAAPVAQAIYILREIKYGGAGCPVPPYVCAVCRTEAIIFKTRPFSKLYTKRKIEKYDWDRTPVSPCPELIEDLQNMPAFVRIPIYSLKDESREDDFFKVLRTVRAVQLSMFKREKKSIDEDNFLNVYEYWESLFGQYLNDNNDDRKIAEFFLSDIETGRSLNKNGRVEFIFGNEKVTKSLPVYEYNYFWSLYERVEDEKIIFAIRRKIDRLSEDFARRFEGEFYTPIPFATKAYDYLVKTIGKRRLENGNYRIWDMTAGSGNLEFTLPEAALPYTYISTLSQDDANYCQRIFSDAEVFQYDYLNDDIDIIFDEKEDKQLNLNEYKNEHNIRKMPQKLWDDLHNPKLYWLIFINPPFATSNFSKFSSGKASKSGVSDTKVREKMLYEGYGETGRELFSQFLFRISCEFVGKKGYLGLFSTLKYINAPNDKRLRDGFFNYKPERGFVFSSENFEGSKGKFPVSFVVWNLEKKRKKTDKDIILDMYNKDAEKIGTKKVVVGGTEKLLSSWVNRPTTKYVFPPFKGALNIASENIDVRDRVAENFICSLMCCGNDFQHQNQTALFSGPQASAGSYSVVPENFEKSMIIHTVRKLPVATWSNNRDQFYCPIAMPNDEFITDCAIWSIFSDSNNAVSLNNVNYKGKKYRVENKLFPFSRNDVNQWIKKCNNINMDEFYPIKEEVQQLALYESNDKESFFFNWIKDRKLSDWALKVYEKAKDLYKYCYERGKAVIWDMGYPQIKLALFDDEQGKNLLNVLKEAHKELGRILLPRLYSYGFIPEDAHYFEED